MGFFMEGLKDWYQMPPKEVFAQCESDPEGLSDQVATDRLKNFGLNELEYQRTSAWIRFLRQFHNALVYILLAAALITGILTVTGEDMMADTVVILAVVILNAILGYFQEDKAENALRALQNMIVPECTVLRTGRQRIIPARELVPGDVVVLAGGDKIPADLRLFEANNVTVDEAVLTGESVPSEKSIDLLEASNLTPADQHCILFSGTFMTHGTAKGVVVKTGEKTEFGKIALLVKQTETVLTPLQKKITDFTRTLITAILIVGLLNFFMGNVFGYTITYSFLASVSLIVAAIPEMLPMILTAILALAATRMAHRNALIRRLPAAETLGCATVICSDKTGTLTKNEMTVRKIYAGERLLEISGVGYEPVGDFLSNSKARPVSSLPLPLYETLKVGFLCNDSSLIHDDEHYAVIGDPTEGALLVSALKADMHFEGRKLDEIPFDSEKMYMATLFEGEKENTIYLKGSPERVLDLCETQNFASGIKSLDRKAVFKAAETMASEALRVLGMAMRKVPKSQRTITTEDIQKMEFQGLQGMIDPPREEAIEAVEKCKMAGVRTIMITGDHLMTAKAIAKQLGIIEDEKAPALTGVELNGMSDEELADVIEHVSVFARVAPEHKLRIAQQLQHKGHIIAMTGDGVNDAPALKAADIGIAMGITGTEVSKEASSMVLTDDNFATIVGAVEEGRNAWNNLEKAILYTLPTNGGQAFLVMGAVLLAPFMPIFSFRLPLEPVQILWVNLFDSVFLTMPLMMEPKQEHILDTPPRNSEQKIANLLFLQRVIFIGLAIAIPGFLIYHHFGAPAIVDGKLVDPLLLTQAQTAAFWAVLLVHFGFLISARSVFRSAFTFNPFSNQWILIGILVSILTRLLPTFSPFFATLFRTAEFPMEWWLYILPCLLPGFIVLELDKLIRRLFRKRADRI